MAFIKSEDSRIRGMHVFHYMMINETLQIVIKVCSIMKSECLRCIGCYAVLLYTKSCVFMQNFLDDAL